MTNSHNEQKMRTIDIVIIAMLAAITYAIKVALAGLPNIELVSLLLCVYAIALGLWRGVAIGLVFSVLTLLDGGAYGLSDWVFLYFFDWTILPVLSHFIVRSKEKEMRAAVLLGLFGLLFTLPSYPLKLAMFGPAYLYSYMIADIPFSAVHGASNFIIALFLFQPLCRDIDAAYRQIRTK